MKDKKVFLSIAGSDPSGGAGIQADIKTAVKIGLYPCSVITAVTAQNTSGVQGIWSVGNDKLKAQLYSVLSDIRPHALKIGLIGSQEAITVLRSIIEQYELTNVVVDPVLSTTLDSRTPDSEFIKLLVTELFPMATLITPNIPEKEIIEKTMGTSLEELCEAFLLKGGHSSGKDCEDILFYNNLATPNQEFQSSAFPSITNSNQPFFPQDSSPLSENEYRRIPVMKKFIHRRLDSENTHGSGCVLSSAVACFLAQGLHLEKAVDRALKFTQEAIKESSSFRLGKGNYGPTLL